MEEGKENNHPETNDKEGQSKETTEIKEERIRSIALSYYSRKDVLSAIYEFSDRREVVPRYYDGFGKRPDILQYPSDILSMAKRGATSFHCSEEIWNDPLQLAIGLGPEELNKLRVGWDLIIDIDCKWIYYSKKAAQAIIKVLNDHGVKNIGIKFSGSKGFHIIVPWNSFPKEFGDEKTSHKFPEYPRAVVNYLKEKSRKILERAISETEADFKKVKGLTGIKCESCNNLATENYQVSLRCSTCYPPYIESFKTSTKEYKKRKCPNCKKILEEVSSKTYYHCPRCNLDSIQNKSNFNEEIESIDVFEVLGLDVLLVSPRHLFRMPYSLHEKTSLVSTVVLKEELDSFELNDANPLNVKIRKFYPESREGEAKDLLFQAIDWYKSHEAKSTKLNLKTNEENKNKVFEKVKLLDFKDEYFPPAIIKILNGMVEGKKRSLFILMNFFRSIGMEMEEIEKKVNEWNKKNNPPLKQGYINAQLIWHTKNPVVLPPNFDNEIYKAIGVYEMDDLSMKVKNPVTYTVKKYNALRKNKRKKE